MELSHYYAAITTILVITKAAGPDLLDQTKVRLGQHPVSSSGLPIASGNYTDSMKGTALPIITHHQMVLGGTLFLKLKVSCHYWD